MRKWILLIVAIHPAFAASTPGAAPAPGNEETDLKRRVLQLEQQTEALKKSYDAFVESTAKKIKDGALAQETALDLEKQLHSKLQATGYADVEFRDSSAAGKYPGFRIHHFSLILTKQISEHWRSFAEIEYEDAPRVVFDPPDATCPSECSGQIFLETMNIDYSPNDAIGLRFGRFFTPAGIWSIDHYPPFVATQERPLHIRHMFPQVIDGALLHGTLPYNEVFLNYDVYVGNGESSNGSRDNDSRKSRGLRVAAQLPWLTQFELGTSAYADTLIEADGHETRKLSTGLHTKARRGPLAFQTEIARAHFQPENGAAHTANGYYAQFSFDTSPATALGYRYELFEDYKEDAKGDITMTEKRRNTYFANYRVHKNVVIKLEHHLTTKDGAQRERLTIASLAVYLGE